MRKHTQGHFKLVNHQIARVRSALAIATLTGRAIIVPQLWCGQDRWWAPHSGELHAAIPCFSLPLFLMQLIAALEQGPSIAHMLAAPSHPRDSDPHTHQMTARSCRALRALSICSCMYLP